MRQIKRGDIYYVDLNPVIGSEQGGIRPVLNIQNNIGNQHSPTIIAAAITSTLNKPKLPTHVEISCEDLPQNSIVLLEQVRTVDKRRLMRFVGQLDRKYMINVNKAIEISFGLNYPEVLEDE